MDKLKEMEMVNVSDFEECSVDYTEHNNSFVVDSLWSMAVLSPQETIRTLPHFASHTVVYLFSEKKVSSHVLDEVTDCVSEEDHDCLSVENIMCFQSLPFFLSIPEGSLQEKRDKLCSILLGEECQSFMKNVDLIVMSYEIKGTRINYAVSKNRGFDTVLIHDDSFSVLSENFEHITPFTVSLLWSILNTDEDSRLIQEMEDLQELSMSEYLFEQKTNWTDLFMKGHSMDIEEIIEKTS